MSSRSRPHAPVWIEAAIIDLDSITNISHSLLRGAVLHPDQMAVAEPGRGQSFRKISYRELRDQAIQIAAGVRSAGVSPGARISLLVPPGIDFVAWVFGLLLARATVVLIDPGMGRRNMIRCLAEANPVGIAGVGIAQLIRMAMRKKFPQARLNFHIRPTWPVWGADTRKFFQLPPTQCNEDHPFGQSSLEDPAAIIFTTGSTGPPKGVLYRHRHFLEQTKQIRDYFGIRPGGSDVSGFPLFALFNIGMGTQTIFPKMDATRPAKIDPKNFLNAVREFQAVQSFGSPALWNTVARYCEKNGIRMPSLERVLTAGAPVPPHVLQRVRNSIAESGEVHTPYGATEALPVACIESRAVLQETAVLTQRGRGTCVGLRWPQIDWRVIEIRDEPLTCMEETRVLPTGEIGELMVSGPVVTDQYVTRMEANAFHKIQDGSRIWHRMGDVGYLDEQGRFWFCGRKSHRVQTRQGTLFTIPCESIVNNHPCVYRSALVGVGPPGEQTPVLIVEPWPEHWPKNRRRHRELVEELRLLAHNHELTASVGHLFLMKALPVDIRHNAKIFREKLARWAHAQLNRQGLI